MIDQPFPLILASGSPRRKELLSQIGLIFSIVPSQADEVPCKDAMPDAYVQRLSKEKAFLVAQEYPGSFVLGADTIVVLDNKILEKPATPAESRTMLRMLSAQTHEVYTGFSLLCLDKNIEETNIITTQVTFKTLTLDEISWYSSTIEPYDKAGGYALQGIGGFFVEKICGSYTNVIGLPLTEVMAVLIKHGACRFIKG